MPDKPKSKIGEVRKDSVTLPIYRTKTGFLVKYRLKKKLYQIHRATEAKAREAGKKACELIASGQTAQLSISNEDAAQWQRVKTIAANIGKSPEAIAQEYHDLFLKILGGGSLTDAVNLWNKRQSSEAITRKKTPEIYEEFIASKESKRRSALHLSDLKKRLGRFAKQFTWDMEDVTGEEIEAWLSSLRVQRKKPGDKPMPLSPRSLNNFRAAIANLVGFAKRKKYLPADWSELERVEIIEIRKKETILIFTVDEMSKLLTAANDVQLPFLAIGAFSGVRHEELKRLSWENILWDSRFIEIPAKVAKTGSRRLIPLKDNLLEWLLPYRQKTGPICERVDMGHQMEALSKKSGVKWKRNAPRHGYASYRVAECQDIGRTATESGNSIQKIKSNYLEVVPPAEAKRWFSLVPGGEKTVTNWLQKTG